MAFNDIKKVEDYQFYLDKAISRAQNNASLMRAKKSKIHGIERSKSIEQSKVNIIADILVNELNKIVHEFPRIEELDNFYKELVKASIDYPMLKKSLGALNWANLKIAEFNRVYSEKIRRARTIVLINKHRKEFYGRVSSLLKQVKKEFTNIDNARIIMRKFPVVKTKLKTIAIAGFPNVGKTTLLAKLTGAKAEIANYAFTTKGINLGYYESETEKIQFIDTPGTLNRFNKMNMYEKHAYLALKWLTESIVYVFDLSEASYPIEDQIKLYDEINKLGKKMYVYLSKEDIIDDKTIINEFKKKYNVIDEKYIITKI